jgi:hypothetical protein
MVMRRPACCCIVVRGYARGAAVVRACPVVAGFMIAENDTPACTSRPDLHADVSQTAIMKPATPPVEVIGNTGPQSAHKPLGAQCEPGPPFTQCHQRSQIVNLALPCPQPLHPHQPTSNPPPRTSGHKRHQPCEHHRQSQSQEVTQRADQAATQDPNPHDSARSRRSPQVDQSRTAT